MPWNPPCCARKNWPRGTAKRARAHAIAMTRVYIAGAMERIESAARMVIAACGEGDMLRSQMAILRRLVQVRTV